MLHTSEGSVNCEVVRCVRPVLQQYLHLAQCYMTASISSHRATVKLFSTLLAIFTELTQKVSISILGSVYIAAKANHHLYMYTISVYWVM